MKYCAACLSGDRRVLCIKDLQDVTPLIEFLNVNLNISDVLCWECRAMFKRISTFRSQIQRAQKIMTMWQRSKTKKKMKSLSKLSTIIKDTYDEIFSTKNVNDESIYETNLEDYNEVHFIEDWNGFEDNESSDSDNHKIINDCKEGVTVFDSEGDVNCFVSVQEMNDTDHAEDIVMKSSFENEGGTKNDNEDTKAIQDDENTVYAVEEEIKDETITSDPELPEQISYKVDPIMKLSRDEENFTVTRMTLQEMYKCRDLDRNAPVYKRCPYKCLKCIAGYYQEAKYERHLREKHALESKGRRKIHHCTICQIRFTRWDALKMHYDRHFRKYQCKICNFSHHKLATMLVHKSSKHNSGTVYTCDICDKEFDRRRSMWYHKKTHQEKPTCDVCGKTASTKHNLKIHMMLHTGVKRVQCDECGRWVRRTSLRAHLRTHGARHEDAFCAECGLQFATRALYQRHLKFSRRHAEAGVTKFPCTMCEYQFTDKFTLARHVAAKHLKMYPFRCHLCNKGFIRKDRMQKHISERHDGLSRPKDKICVYCGKGFKDNSTLKRHVRVHTGERPYCCPHCDATFAQASTRNTHVKALHKDVIKKTNTV